MDKRKEANQRVKDRLFCALIEYAERKDCSNLSLSFRHDINGTISVF